MDNQTESMRVQLRVLIDDTDTRWGKAFHLMIQVLIIVSLLEGALESLPSMTPMAVLILNTVEICTVMVFSLEYLMRLYAAEHRLKFAFSFFGIVDLVAILPFYLVTGLDFRAIRAFRLFRLFRILKFARYGRVITRFGLALRLAREELVLFTVASAMVLYLASVGIYYCERAAQPEVFASIVHSMWWAVATFTTVGYGDIYPVTPLGKLFTAIMLFVGLGFVAVPSGIIATALTEARDILGEHESFEDDEL